MTIVLIVVSSLALLAAGACLISLEREKKRSEKRKTALMQYIKAEQKTFEVKFEKRISDLESGIVPNFEKAKAAADAVNDFNAGISAILGFDPHEVLKKQKNNTAGGDNG